MNSPALLNLPDHYRGDSVEELVFEINDADVPTLSGCTCKLQVRDSKNKLIKEYSTTDSSIVISLPITLSIPKHVWGEVSGQFKYDLQVTTPGGNVYSYLRGKWNIVEDVTL